MGQRTTRIPSPDADPFTDPDLADDTAIIEDLADDDEPVHELEPAEPEPEPGPGEEPAPGVVLDGGDAELDLPPADDLVAAWLDQARQINSEVGQPSPRTNPGGPLENAESVLFVLDADTIRLLASNGEHIKDLADGDLIPGTVVDAAAGRIALLFTGNRSIDVFGVEPIDPPDEVGLEHCGRCF